MNTKTYNSAKRNDVNKNELIAYNNYYRTNSQLHRTIKNKIKLSKSACVVW